MNFSGRLTAVGIPALLLLAVGLTTPDLPALQAMPAGQDPVCSPSPNMPLEGRASPYDSASVQLAEGMVKICYGRPSARGRTMIGGENVPFGEPWRTGANEPTTLHTTIPLRVADVALEPGSYTIYTEPGAESWQLFVSRATDRWGIPISPEVRAEELGSATLPRDRPEEHVETFTIRFGDPADGSVPLILEWEEFRITVPVEQGSR